MSNRLRAILYMIAAVVYARWNYCLMVTDCLRSDAEDQSFGGVGIHPTGRAVDFNFCDTVGERIHHPERTEQLKELVNGLIPYGYGHYKTLIYHDVAGLHFHLQVSRNKTTELTEG